MRPVLILLIVVILSGCYAEVEGPSQTRSLPEPERRIEVGSVRQERLSCDTHVVNYGVRGNSLSGVIEAGDVVEIVEGYHECYDVARDDIVAFRNGDNLLIKRVVAVPGDEFYEEEGYIHVNGEKIYDAEGNPYETTPMIDLYVEGYDVVVPEDAYLVLGNARGSRDSRSFGLIGHTDIIGVMRRGSVPKGRKMYTV